MIFNAWWIVVIIIASALVLVLFFWWQSSKTIKTIEHKTFPAPLQTVVGPKAVTEHPGSGLRGIEKSRGKGIEEGSIPLMLKTVVSFYETIYIGETYTLKTYIFNTAKNAENADSVIKDLLTKDQMKGQQKKFETDSLYAKDQEPVRIKIDVAAPNFIIAPASRIIEIPAGTSAVSTHLLALNNSNPPSAIIGQVQTILLSYDQILDASTITHLGTIEYQVKVGRGYIPPEINSELKTQTKIRYVSTVAGAGAAVITIVSTLIATLMSLGILV